MTTTTVKQPTIKLEDTKPVVEGIELSLEQILADAWNQGSPNDILTAF